VVNQMPDGDVLAPTTTRSTMSHGYDVVGDVHGQHDKLKGLVELLGYRQIGGSWSHPEGRQLVFVPTPTSGHLLAAGRPHPSCRRS